ncbi:MAG: DUF2935 domain-containing protein [Bacilli bacterium]
MKTHQHLAELNPEAYYYEHDFWLHVLRDHSVFIGENLAATEARLLTHNANFMYMIECLIMKLQEIRKRSWSVEPAYSFNCEALNVATHFRNFNQHILDLSLVCKVKIQMTPTFLEHMTREAEEYISVIQLLQTGCPVLPATLTLHQHLLWLPDASGHAAIIRSKVDPTEQEIIDQTSMFKMDFEALYKRALELSTMLNTNPRYIPSLDRLNEMSTEQINMFIHFLEDLELMAKECAILGSVSPLMADHMARESKYYIDKIWAASRAEHEED